ncbi:sulfate transporter [Turneriella parva DSM 21527]|uniref:Sulfate transporter n=2 Tax=Turneriella TaxID=338321 RepID=I4B3W7_TURPD|nr:sulfate transporter [Turneriella parva DSM 21527]
MFMRFDRHELAGSFGDIGTDLPLLIGMIAAGGLDAGHVFLVFGSLQILSGIYYRLPMPMQPLKAMAVIVIAGKLSPGIIYGGGVAIGVTMLALTATGLLARVAALFPLAVVRGIQFGLGLSLALLAVRSYIWPSGVMGWYAAAGGFFIMLILWQNRRLPAGLVLVAAAVLYGALTQNTPTALATSWRADWLTFQLPSATDIATGFLLLALPQLPLSLANSVVATRQTCADLFPDRDVSIRKIGVTYGVANLVSASFGGVPVCHGSGGLVGHHNFGARTGASVVIYGAIFVTAALLFGHRAKDVLALFPLSVLGVILTFEAFGLMRLARLTEPAKWAQFVTLATGLVCAMAPHGFLVGSVTGITLYHAPNLWRKVRP